MDQNNSEYGHFLCSERFDATYLFSKKAGLKRSLKAAYIFRVFKFQSCLAVT